MKTLYITDLDGTFLNSEAEITSYSAEIIRKLISDGGFFLLQRQEQRLLFLICLNQ